VLVWLQLLNVHTAKLTRSGRNKNVGFMRPNILRLEWVSHSIVRAMATTVTETTARRSSPNWLFVAALFVLCMSGLAAFGFRSQPLDPLAVTLAEIGKAEVMPAPAARFFMVPGDSVPMREVRLRSEGGNIRSAQLLQQSGDIFFLEEPSDKSRTYFYRTNRRGKLMLACYMDATSEPQPIDDVQVRFDKEKDFWMTYQRERAKHDPLNHKSDY